MGHRFVGGFSIDQAERDGLVINIRSAVVAPGVFIRNELRLWTHGKIDRKIGRRARQLGLLGTCVADQRDPRELPLIRISRNRRQRDDRIVGAEFQITRRNGNRALKRNEAARALVPGAGLIRADVQRRFAGNAWCGAQRNVNRNRQDERQRRGNAG
jgi:hypothetical protein